MSKSKTYRLKSFSDESSYQRYTLSKHSSGAMLLEGHGICANKIPLSARSFTTKEHQQHSSHHGVRDEDMDFIADLTDELVQFYVKQLLAQKAVREVSKIDDRFSMFRVLAVEEEKNGFRRPKEQEKRMKTREIENELEEMLGMETMIITGAGESRKEHLIYDGKRQYERSHSPVMDQILGGSGGGGVPKRLPGEFEAKSLAELEGLNTAFTPMKKNEFPSSASVEDLTLEGLGIEESDPITESAMKPNNGRRNGNEMENMKKLAKEQKREREAAKKLKAERERREKKQAKALGGSLIANLFNKSPDKKNTGGNTSGNNEKKGQSQKKGKEAAATTTTAAPKLLSGLGKPAVVVAVATKQENGASQALKEKPKKETKVPERRELQKVRKEITATLRGIEDSFDLVLEDAEDGKEGAHENAEKFLAKLRALSMAISKAV